MKTTFIVVLCVIVTQFGTKAQNWSRQRLGGSQAPDLEAAQGLAEAKATYNAMQIQAEQDAFVPLDPWRSIYGITNYIKNSGVEFCGKIIKVQPTGVRIKGSYGPLFTTSYNPSDFGDNNTEFFVANFPFEAAENEFIPETNHWMAFYVGTYSYTTVAGGSRTIRKLDYGNPCTPPPELIKQLAEIQQEQAKLQRKKIEESQHRAFLWLQTQATNGSPSAQCSLGLHYLDGQGCETNKSLAIRWLTKAASQGSLEASNKLVEIQLSSTILTTSPKSP
jgi:Sel1 repeat